jgi:hypothetical protein
MTTRPYCTPCCTMCNLKTCFFSRTCPFSPDVRARSGLRHVLRRYRETYQPEDRQEFSIAVWAVVMIVRAGLSGLSRGISPVTSGARPCPAAHVHPPGAACPRVGGAAGAGEALPRTCHLPTVLMAAKGSRGAHALAGVAEIGSTVKWPTLGPEARRPAAVRRALAISGRHALVQCDSTPPLLMPPRIAQAASPVASQRMHQDAHRP